MTKNSNAADLYLAIKARVVDDLETMEEKIFNFSQTIGHSAYQEDIYFQVGTGQLKLRLTSKNCDVGQLITSKAVSSTTPNLIETQSSEVHEFKNMRKTLSLCMPELASIKKRRRVYVKDNIRINLDDVENLGLFVDIEIQGSDEESRNEQAENVKRELEINEGQLITSTYLELYRKLKTADSGLDDDLSDVSIS